MKVGEGHRYHLEECQKVSALMQTDESRSKTVQPLLGECFMLQCMLLGDLLELLLHCIL